jgi:hypothetical protein
MLITAPLQTPQMEGDQDTEVFSGKTVEQVPYFQVRSTSGDSLAIVGGGQLAGILPGTELAFHPPETHEPSISEPLGSGTVRRVDPLRAEVVLREPVDPEKLRASRAFVTSRAFGDFQVGLRLEGLSPEDQATVERELLTVGTVRMVTENPDLVLRRREAGNGVVLVSAWDDSVLLSPSAPDAGVWVSEVVNRARSYAVGRLLKSTEMSSPEIQVSLNILPALHWFRADGTCDGSESAVLDPNSALSEGGQLEFTPEEGFLLELVNSGPSSAYVTVLHLSSTGEIDQLFPRSDLGGDDNLLEAGASHRIGLCFSAPAQVGKEVLKLFATRENVDFEAVTVLDRTYRGHAYGTPLERLFAEALSGTRSSPSSGARTAGHTGMVSFQVVSKTRRERRETRRGEEEGGPGTVPSF